MKIVHLTDIHLDCVQGSLQDAARAATADLSDEEVFVITGDIATADAFPTLLPEFVRGLRPMGYTRRVFFVLGNHDAWKGSVEGSRRSARKLSMHHRDVLTYLPDAGCRSTSGRSGTP